MFDILSFELMKDDLYLEGFHLMKSQKKTFLSRGASDPPPHARALKLFYENNKMSAPMDIIFTTVSEYVWKIYIQVTGLDC